MDIKSVFPQDIFDWGWVELWGLKLHLHLSDVVLTSLLVSVLLVFFSLRLTRQLSVENPGNAQLLLESLFIAMARTIRDFSQMNITPFFNLIATFWIFVTCANLIGLLPIFGTPTRDLGAVVALSSITFASIYYFGIRFHGWGFLKRFVEPYAFLLPLNLIGELGRILSLTFRLFGNMLGWELIIAILIVLTGILIPIPMMLFNVVGNLIQAYLFGILTLVYIISGLKVEALDQRLTLKEDWYDD